VPQSAHVSLVIYSWCWSTSQQSHGLAIVALVDR